MKSIFRKTLLVFAMLCFLIISPSLVFYAMGYRFDFDSRSIKKVGMLILESSPQEAEVHLNNKLIGSKTPHKAKNLMPGEYQIKVSRPNYTTWEKRLTVKSKEVNWASHILLFFRNPREKNLTTLPASDFVFNKSYDKIVYFVGSGDEKGVWLLDLRNGSDKKFFKEEDGDFQNLSFSPDEKKILFYWKKSAKNYRYVIYEMGTNKIFYLDDFFQHTVEKIKWDKEGKKLFFKSQARLFQFDLVKKFVSQIASNILDFEIQGDEVFVLKKNEKKKKVFLKSLNANGERKKTKTIKKAPISNSMMIAASQKGYLAYYDFDNSVLYLYKNGEQKNISNAKIKKMAWSKAGDKLLYFNENELFFYPLTESENTKWHPEYRLNAENLIVRITQEIEEAKFFDDEHVIFLTSDYIKIMELDERDKRNTYEIGVKNAFDLQFDDENNKKIYFIEEDKKSLKELEIRKD